MRAAVNGAGTVMECSISLFWLKEMPSKFISTYKVVTNLARTSTFRRIFFLLYQPLGVERSRQAVVQKMTALNHSPWPNKSRSPAAAAHNSANLLLFLLQAISMQEMPSKYYARKRNCTELFLYITKMITPKGPSINDVTPERKGGGQKKLRFGVIFKA